MRLVPGLMLAGGVASALCGCSNAGQKAEERLAMVERNGGSKAEVCDAAKAVADAYLTAGDEAKYKQAKLTADIDCFDVRGTGS